MSRGRICPREIRPGYTPPGPRHPTSEPPAWARWTRPPPPSPRPGTKPDRRRPADEQPAGCENAWIRIARPGARLADERRIPKCPRPAAGRGLQGDNDAGIRRQDDIRPGQRQQMWSGVMGRLDRGFVNVLPPNRAAGRITCRVTHDRRDSTGPSNRVWTASNRPSRMMGVPSHAAAGSAPALTAGSVHITCNRSSGPGCSGCQRNATKALFASPRGPNVGRAESSVNPVAVDRQREIAAGGHG